MSPALFDTTILIAHLRGDERATQLISSAVAAGAAHASVLSRTELEGGMRSGERTTVARLFSALEMATVTDAIAARGGEHLRRFRRSHSGIDVVDYLLAATAEHLGAELMTFNVRHFPMFPLLQSPFPP